ncbi:hypothetical protein [Fusobacterium varium]|uniref:hypothetical protein n=1 Tax=Fusobacterium varium TaxID=856 RepID=UPI0029256F25|nr:hypothetical protein AUSP0054_00061 [uncultured phage]
MWITFKDKINNDEKIWSEDKKTYSMGKQIVTRKINSDKIEGIIFYEEKIELYPTIEEAFYTIDKVLNKNFEEIKQKLMEL